MLFVLSNIFVQTFILILLNWHHEPRFFANVITDVAELRELREAVRRSQKMAALGQLSHRVAHDFANALSAITGSLGLINSYAGDDPRIKASLDDAAAGAKNAANLSSQLMAFAHPSPPNTSLIDLAKVVKGISPFLDKTLGPAVELHVTSSGNCKVPVDVAKIEQAIMHIAINALDAMDGKGKMSIDISPMSMQEAQLLLEMTSEADADTHPGFAQLTISDDGRGMDEETQRRLFEPFFTTKKDASRHGGLGMATTYNIIAQHRGHITVTSQPGEGTTIRIYLPLAKS